MIFVFLFVSSTDRSNSSSISSGVDLFGWMLLQRSLLLLKSISFFFWENVAITYLSVPMGVAELSTLRAVVNGRSTWGFVCTSVQAPLKSFGNCVRKVHAAYRNSIISSHIFQQFMQFYDHHKTHQFGLPPRNIPHTHFRMHWAIFCS